VLAARVDNGLGAYPLQKKAMKTGRGRGRDEWLNAFQGFKKYLNQCVMCQEVGYDPVKVEAKEGRYFKARMLEYFHPLTVNEVGLCPGCAERCQEQSVSVPGQ
jgi:hypothetical protein